MKNQYFGDVNDYLKYGLLRILADSGNNKIGVCWMLTADDSTRQGNNTRYLLTPAAWRSCRSEDVCREGSDDGLWFGRLNRFVVAAERSYGNEPDDGGEQAIENGRLHQHLHLGIMNQIMVISNG